MIDWVLSATVVVLALSNAFLWAKIVRTQAGLVKVAQLLGQVVELQGSIINRFVMKGDK